VTDFAPTPLHGAAYSVAIETVGGTNVIGGCSTPEFYNELMGKLRALDLWAQTQPPDVRKAYRYGIDKVSADLKARLDIFENSRKVRAALASIPRPSDG